MQKDAASSTGFFVHQICSCGSRCWSVLLLLFLAFVFRLLEH